MSDLNLQFQKDWLFNKSVLSYTLYSLNNTTMQDWSQDILATIENWQGADKPRLFFDLSNTNVSMSYFNLTRRDLFNFAPTPDAEKKLDALIEKHPKLRMKLAVLLSRTMVGVLTGGRATNTLRQFIVGKVFFEHEVALEWLRAEDSYAQDMRTRTIDVQTLLQDTDLGPLGSEAYRKAMNELRLLVNGSLEIVPISEESPVVIGRSARATLDVTTHGKPSLTVSRKHAAISMVGGELMITDLGSSNGTYLDGKQLSANTPKPIRRDDEIRMGALTIRVLF